MVLLDTPWSTMVNEYSDIHHTTVQYYGITIICGDTTMVFLKYLRGKLGLIKVVIICTWYHSGIIMIFVDTTVTVIQCILWHAPKYHGKLIW